MYLFCCSLTNGSCWPVVGGDEGPLGGFPSAAGFEGCSMVPSIYPLETLHNSLSLKQVDDFLNRVCESSSEAHAKTMKGETRPSLRASAPIPDKPMWRVSAVLSSLFDSQSQSSLYSPQCPLSSSGSETSLQPPSQNVWRECGIDTDWSRL